jgi:1,2-diacylglycerol 3-beta-galactosyltransferase
MVGGPAAAHEVRIVDALALGRWPVSTSPRVYGPFVNRFPALWGLGYALTDSARGAAMLDFVHSRALSRPLSALYDEFRPDLVVSFHGLLTRPAREILHQVSPGTPFATVVTDLGSAHAAWFDAEPDRLFVPNERLESVAIAQGVPADRIRRIGQPIRPVFADTPHQSRSDDDRQRQREALGLEPTMKTALLLGGGEGFGKLDRIARAIDQAELPLQLVVATGKNQRLRAKMEKRRWKRPTTVLGFVDNLHEWMWAADFAITRAGPGVVSEAMAAGLPLLIHGYLPGQETGNVDLVEGEGLGLYRPGARAVSETLEAWLADGFAEASSMSRAALAMARPHAASEIAKLLLDLLDREGGPSVKSIPYRNEASTIQRRYSAPTSTISKRDSTSASSRKVALTEQYFSSESMTARSTALGLRFLPCSS